MTRDEYVAYLKNAALDIGKRAVMSYLVARIPLVGTSFFGGLVSIVVSKVLEIAILETEFAAFFAYVDMRVTKQGNEFSEIAMKYHSAPEGEKAKYEKEYLAKFYDFASFKS